jgi:hypothetical protein
MSMKITPHNAGRLLHITDRTVLNYVRAGHLSAEEERHGFRIFYKLELDDVLAFADKHDIYINDNTLERIKSVSKD